MMVYTGYGCNVILYTLNRKIIFAVTSFNAFIRKKKAQNLIKKKIKRYPLSKIIASKLFFPSIVFRGPTKIIN